MMDSSSKLNTRSSAILLLGPTGSGKTPFGDYSEQSGISGKKCFHFDFGANLRKAAEGSGFLPDEDVELVASLLKTGALLEDKDFHVARNILALFIKEKQVGVDDLIVLNGLPRHVGQAGDIDELIDVEMVVYLECSPEVVRDRIRLNSGGDRAERSDDSTEDIKRKLETFQKRTMPLLDHYRRKGVRIEKIKIKVDSFSADILKQLTTKS